MSSTNSSSNLNGTNNLNGGNNISPFDSLLKITSSNYFNNLIIMSITLINLYGINKNLLNYLNFLLLQIESLQNLIKNSLKLFKLILNYNKKNLTNYYNLVKNLEKDLNNCLNLKINKNFLTFSYEMINKFNSDLNLLNAFNKLKLLNICTEKIELNFLILKNYLVKVKLLNNEFFLNCYSNFFLLYKNFNKYFYDYDVSIYYSNSHPYSSLSFNDSSNNSLSSNSSTSNGNSLAISENLMKIASLELQKYYLLQDKHNASVLDYNDNANKTLDTIALDHTEELPSESAVPSTPSAPSTANTAKSADFDDILLKNYTDSLFIQKISLYVTRLEIELGLTRTLSVLPSAKPFVEQPDPNYYQPDDLGYLYEHEGFPLPIPAGTIITPPDANNSSSVATVSTITAPAEQTYVDYLWISSANFKKFSESVSTLKSLYASAESLNNAIETFPNFYDENDDEQDLTIINDDGELTYLTYDEIKSKIENDIEEEKNDILTFNLATFNSILLTKKKLYRVRYSVHPLLLLKVKDILEKSEKDLKNFELKDNYDKTLAIELAKKSAKKLMSKNKKKKKN